VQDGTDWEILFTGGQPVRGFAFNLIDNEDGQDAVRVYNTSGTLIGSTSVLDKHAFIGITSAVPIGRVELDGDPTDFSAFNGLRFDQVPEPGSATVLMLMGGATLLRREGKRAAD